MDFPSIKMYRGDMEQWAEELVTALERKFRTTETTQNSNFTTGNLIANINLNLQNVQEFDDNAAAVTGGLVAGDVYRTGDNLKIVHA